MLNGDNAPLFEGSDADQESNIYHGRRIGFLVLNEA